MRLKPVLLAADSMGVRSMAVFIEGPPGILIDPSAALGPRRYGLPPAPQEERALEEARRRIASFAERASVIIITHYHYDHYDPHAGFYRGRRVIGKDGTRKINWSQRRRARAFREAVPHIEYTNGSSYTFGELRVKLSPPFPHGPPGSPLGYVLMVTVDDGRERFLFTSDVQGPVDGEATDYIIGEEPTLIYLDGPPTYLAGVRFSKDSLGRARSNLKRILNETEAVVIVDHHLLRDLRYREFLMDLDGGGRLRTAAEWMGVEERLLEARRKELHASVVEG